MKSLPLEIWSCVVDKVVWSSSEKVTLENEAWIDGTVRLLLPDDHPLANAFDSRAGQPLSDVEKTLAALKATSKRFRRIAMRYYDEIDNVTLAVEHYCDCSDVEPTDAGWEEREDASCTTCKREPSPGWDLVVAKGKIKSRVVSLRLKVLSDDDNTFVVYNALRYKGRRIRALPPAAIASLSGYTNLAAVVLGGRNSRSMSEIVDALVLRNKGLRQVSIEIDPVGEYDAALATLGKACALEVLEIEQYSEETGDEPENHQLHAEVDSLFGCIADCASTLRAANLEYVHCSAPSINARSLFADSSFTICITRLRLVHVHAGAKLMTNILEHCSTTLEYLEMEEVDLDYREKGGEVVVFSALRHFEVRVQWSEDDRCPGVTRIPALLPLSWTCPVLAFLESSYLDLHTQDKLDALVARVRSLIPTLKYISVEGEQSCEPPAVTVESMEEALPGGEEGKGSGTRHWPAELNQELREKGVRGRLRFEYTG